MQHLAGHEQSDQNESLSGQDLDPNNKNHIRFSKKGEKAKGTVYSHSVPRFALFKFKQN